PRLHFVFEPVAAARARRDRQSPRPRPANPIQFGSHEVTSWKPQPLRRVRDRVFGNDFPRQSVYINATIPKNLDAMVAIDDGSIGSHLEGSLLSRLQGIDQLLIGQLAILVEF